MLVAFSLASPVVIIPSWFGSQNYSLGTSCLYAVSLSKEKKNKKKKKKQKEKKKNENKKYYKYFSRYNS